MIHDVAEGFVLVCGRVEAAGDLLEAPLTRERCVAYDVEMEKGPRQREMRSFIVVDESGEALIAEGPFVLQLVPYRYGVTTVPASGTRTSVRWLGRIEKPVEPVWYWESTLCVGSLVAVTGTAWREVMADAERPTLRQPPERVVLRGTVDNPLLIGSWANAG
jgi:hypothetical protein